MRGPKVCLTAAVLLLLACGVDPPPSEQAQRPTPGPASAAAPAPTSPPSPPFRLHDILDRQHQMVMARVEVPVDWRVRDSLVWRYEDSMLPARLAARIEAPDGSAWVEVFPEELLFWLEPPTDMYPLGARSLGGIHHPPLPPHEALLQLVIQPQRGGQPGLHVLGSRPIEGLAEALGEKPTPGESVAVRVRYQDGARAVEEEFFGRVAVQRVPYHGPLGTTFQINTVLSLAHSVGATAGELDARRPLLGRIAASLSVNPAWLPMAQNVMQQIQASFDQQIAQGYAQIHAAGQLSRQISAQNDAWLQSFESQRQAAAASSDRSSQAFSNYIRGVETMQDPYWGTSEQPYDYRYHWTDGSGNYVHSNDAGYNPNVGSTQNWQLMEPVPDP